MTGVLTRDPEKASGETFDMIIVGGGIYGAMLSLEASLRGIRSLLLERNDFGEVTTFNSLRIIHGGFRYLQTLDFRRMKESSREQRFFLRNFPELIVPLPCLMPLYGKGLRKPAILKTALYIFDSLSRGRNEGVPPDLQLSPGRTIDVAQTKDIFPAVDPEGLRGGAIWYDAFVRDPQRLLIGILRIATAFGGTVLNYVEADGLLLTGNRVGGIKALDRETGGTVTFKSDIVINSSGPWCRDLAAKFDRDIPRLFRSTMAWNLLLNRTPPSEHALAVSPKKPKGQTYFLVPWNGKLLAGTGHSPWPGTSKDPTPSTESIRSFLDDLNLAIPTLALTRDDIVRVLPGLQPATRAGGTDLADREVIVDHSDHGGPAGLFSISGVKFTTARRVAEKTLDRAFPGIALKNTHENLITEDMRKACIREDILRAELSSDRGEPNWKELLLPVITEESVVHLDDLIYRRTTLWADPGRSETIARSVHHLFNWDESRRKAELARIERATSDDPSSLVARDA
jgi:glycerol-3-phosphate dehydrogenase